MMTAPRPLRLHRAGVAPCRRHWPGRFGRALWLALSMGLAMVLLLAAPPARSQPVELREAQRVVGQAGNGAAVESIRVALPEFLEAGPGSNKSGSNGVHAGYRIALHLDAVPQRPALYASALIANARLRINGHTVLQMPDDPLRPAPRSASRIQLIELPAEFLHAGSNLIELDVAGRPFVSVSRLWFGERDALQPRYQSRLFGRVYGPATVSLLMGALALVVLLLWARQRDALYGYFGIGALAWALHSAWTLLPVTFLQGLNFLVWWTSLFSFFSAMLTIFALRFAGWQAPRFERALWLTALAGPLLLYAANGLNLFDAAREVWPFIWYAAMLVALVAVAQHTWRQRGVASVLLLLCCAVSFGFAIHDWLAIHSDADNAPVYLVPYAGLLFIALMTWMLIDRFVGASRKLEALNSQLEARVAAGSAELRGVLEQMRQARDSAQAANRAKSSFLAAASHDLRQPIHALGLYMGALQGDLLSQRQREMLQRMSDSHAALSSMFDALLDISRMDAGAVVANRGPFALDRLLARVADDTLALAREKGLRLRVRLSPRLSEWRAHSDPLLLERIVRNLLGNAVKYTPRGGVLLSCRWRNADHADAAGVWQIDIWDSGVGIADDERERVFEEFYQIGNPQRDRAGGLGLGLSIVRRLADMLALPLELASRPGHGTRFRLSVPATRGPAPTEVPLAALGLLNGLGVAVIDDDAEVRHAMGALLERWGCRAFTGEHADAVLQRAGPAATAIQIVVADYQLRDGRNGIDEIQSLRAACGSELRALIISADSAPDRLALIQRSGFDYLSKPVAPARLRSWMNQAARAAGPR